MRAGMSGLWAVVLTVAWGNAVAGGPQAPPAERADRSADRWRRAAEDLISRSGLRRGICAVPGIDGDIALELASGSELLVHVRDSRGEKVDALRERAQARGLGIDRLVVEEGTLERLPYADWTIDLLVWTRLEEDAEREPDAAEFLRVLRPEGVAMLAVRDAAAAERLRADLQTRNVNGLAVRTDAEAVWIRFSRPPLAGAGDWSHWEKGPDNNPVSNDEVIRSPYLTQFLAEPFYIGMPSITTAAGGRTFLAVGHIAHHRREWGSLQRLIARNGYNGTVLWERKLPEGYLVHRSAFIATPETFYMIDGPRCLLLDAATGAEKGELRIPGLRGAWKWMASADGVLYALAGEPDPEAETTRGDRSFGGWSWDDLSKGYYARRIPYGFGDALAAFDLGRKEALWIHREETLIDSRGLALRDGRLYLYCPDRHLRALDLRTGEPLWTNGERELLDLIEEPGRGLTSTPGFRTACLAVATPQALVIQGQTRMNVVALSTEDGRLLWTKKKITNNPNAIYADGRIILGVGPRGSHVALDPLSGEVEEDLGFFKRACTRLTASSDSFFCRGEGTLRFDRQSRTVEIDGAARPACNDGALAANGILYIGPWQCDCNLSLIGALGKCSAGDFRFDHEATNAERLEKRDLEIAQPLQTVPEDWPTYRGDSSRAAASPVTVAGELRVLWQYAPPRSFVPTEPTAAGGLVFLAGEDGKIRAIDGRNGSLSWEFPTGGVVKYPPTVWESRVYGGSGDGHVYALEAATGRLLWRFRAAPVERYIPVYGYLSSTWPVGSGVLVRDGTAYFAAGIIDSDGTYLYAVDARTGEVRWQNNSAGHLNDRLRKGVSVQGNLTVLGDTLLLAGGNQISPAPFDLETGRCLAPRFDQGDPKANGGRFVGVFRGAAIQGGRILYSDPRNVATKASFTVPGEAGERRRELSFGGVPPAWNEEIFALVNFKYGKLSCFEAGTVEDVLRERSPEKRRWPSTVADVLERSGKARWASDLGQAERFEVLSLAVAKDAVIAVAHLQERFRAQPQWFVVVFDAASGEPRARRELREEPLPGGLAVDRRGRILISTIDGGIVCLGSRD